MSQVRVVPGYYWVYEDPEHDGCWLCYPIYECETSAGVWQLIAWMSPVYGPQKAEMYSSKQVFDKLGLSVP